MTSLAYDRLLDALHERGSKIISNGVASTAQCPAHEDRNPSLSLRSIEGQALLLCHAGCDTIDVLDALGLTMRDLFDEQRGATYRYDDGRIVHRSPDKGFRQSGNTKSNPASLYHADRLGTSVNGEPRVWYVVEGEKDVHAIEAVGGIATCAPMGAGKWGKVDPSPLFGGKVVVVADRDESGYRHARDVVTSLDGMCQSVRIVIAKTGKDAADHIAAGHGLGDFEQVDLDELIEPTADEPFAGESVGFERSWQDVDLTSVLDGSWQPPRPNVGRRTDGTPILYPGKVHTISSETEGGKTWLALSLVVDELNDGHHVLYLDFEDNEGGIVARLLAMQVSRDVIAERFHYKRPSEQLGGGINLDDLLATLNEHGDALTLAIIDGITEAMTLHGLNPLDNREVAVFGKLLPRRIANRGPAVACLDHVTKSKDGRGRYAIGAVHKLNGLDGAAFLLHNKQPFGIGLTGRSEIVGVKDRPGQLKRHGIVRDEGTFYFGDLVGESHAEDFIEVTIEPPQQRDATWRPTVLMQRVSDALAGHGELSSKTQIVTAVGAKKETTLKAIDFLILDGYVTKQSPYKLLKPYTKPE